MPDTWDSLTKERRNEKVALEVMGYHRGTKLANRDFWYDDQNQRVSLVYMYRPTEDIGWAWKVQERMTELGLEHQWAAFLEGLFSTIEFVAGDRTWRYAWATPDQRCHAAVLAVGGMNDAG